MKFKVKFKSVRTKLLASFAALSIVLAIVGWFGISEQSSIASKGRAIFASSMQPLENITTVQENFLNARFDVVDATMNSGDQSPLIAKIQQEIATADDSWTKYKAAANAGDAQQAALIKQFDDAWDVVQERHAGVVPDRAFAQRRALEQHDGRPRHTLRGEGVDHSERPRQR